MGWWTSLKSLFGAAPQPASPVQEVLDAPAAQPLPVVRRADPAVDAIDLPDQLRAQVAEHARSQQQIEATLTTLAGAMQSIPQLAQQQSQVLQTLLDQSVRARQRDQAVERQLTELTGGAERQVQTLGLVQQQLDLNHEVSLRVAESLKEVSGAMGSIATSSDRHSRSIEALVQATQRRVSQSDRLERTLQFWLAAVALICTVAMLYAVWSATKGPVVIAMPLPQPSATDAQAQPAGGPAEATVHAEGQHESGVDERAEADPAR